MNRYGKRRKARFCRSRSPLRRLAFEQLDGRLVLSAGALGQAALVDAELVSDAGFAAPAETADEAAGGQSELSPETTPTDPSDLLVFFLISTQSNLGQSMAALPEDGPMPQATDGPSLVADEPGSDSGLSGFLTLEANGTAGVGIVIAGPDPFGVFGPHVRGWDFDTYDTEIVALQLSSTGTVETEILALDLNCTGSFDAEIVAMDLSGADTFDTEMVSMQLSDIAPPRAPRGVVIAASESSNVTGTVETELVALDLWGVDSFFDVYVEIELPGAVGGSGPAGFTEADLEAFILDLELGLE